MFKWPRKQDKENRERKKEETNRKQNINRQT